MSFFIIRKLSTLIPPKIASAKNIGTNPNAKRMMELVSFYKKLPTGQAPALEKPTGPIGKYLHKYIRTDKPSGKPLLHFAIAVMVLGYCAEYSHLKAHKAH